MTVTAIRAEGIAASQEGESTQKADSTVLKTDAAAQAVLSTVEGESASTVSLEGKAEELKSLEFPIIDLVQQMTPDDLQELKKELDTVENMAAEGQFEEHTNFILELRQIVAKAFAQRGRLSEKDRAQLDKLREQYQAATKEGADLLKKVGTAGLITAFVAMTIFVGQFGFADQGAQQAMKFASEQTTGVSGIFTSALSAKQKEKEGEAALTHTEVSAKENQKQSEASATQELSSVLQSALEAEKRAAAG